MKRILLILTVIFLASCQKAPELTFTGSSNMELSVDGGSATITFTANRDWTVSSSDSWVSVSPSSGTASDAPISVVIRCGANTTYDVRAATITIKMEELTQMVTVRQPANLGIVLPTQSYDLQADARTIEVTAQANVDYTVETSVDWIKQAGTKALTSKTLNFSIEENKTFDPREGKITIKPKQAGVAEQVISVKQAQKDALSVEKTSYDMPYGGGEIEIKVEANVAYDVTPNVDWLHFVSTKALSSSTVVIKVDENATYSAREGKIEIGQQNGSLKQTITVKQAGRIAVASIELSQAVLTMRVGNIDFLSATVKPDNATDKTVSWRSSNTDIASVDNYGKVTALKDGTTTIIANAGEKKAECTVTVSLPPDGAIDLGVLISREDGSAYNLYWAECNIGASQPEEYGDYYAWGETEIKDNYTWETYKFRTSGDGFNATYSKYNTNTSYGLVDNKTVLDPDDDVAHVKLGGTWRMPTQVELDALYIQCAWTWTNRNGVNGYEVKSKVNSNSIFLPAAGEQYGASPYTGVGYYWSSSLNASGPYYAYDLWFDSDHVSWGSPYFRVGGLTIRAVTE